jgi:excisionase family DNA binding protein
MMITVVEVAARLRMSRACVYQLVHAGRLTSYRIGLGRGAIRISEEDLAAYVEGCRDTGNAGASMPPGPVRLKHLKQ